MKQLAKLLPIKTIDEAVEEAKAFIQAERNGKIVGLYTRWNGINRAKFKYWRWGNVTLIAGASGSGKSAILNMIEDDFSNINLNPTFLLKFNPTNNSWYWDGKYINDPKIMILAFKFEMKASDEILRNLSGKVQKSYAYLLSSQLDKIKTELNKKESYNEIDDIEYFQLCEELDKLKTKPIRYVESAGNVEQIWNTCVEFKTLNPNRKLIVTLDHTLLSEKLSEKDDGELMSSMAKLAFRLNKGLNAAVIFLGQLNTGIESSLRRTDLSLQFPIKSDIHWGAQIYWACDDVVIFHRPELLNIKKYGNNPFPLRTESLIHGHWIKSRFNNVGSIYFQEKFKEGTMIQIDPKDMEFKQTMFPQ